MMKEPSADRVPVDHQESTNQLQVASSLHHAKATLHESIQLDANLALALWSNRQSRASYVRPQHHTLSLYLRGGQQTQRVLHGGLQQGGGPDKLCIMPEGHESHWLIGEDFSFIHLYFSKQQLQRCAERVWDKEARGLSLDECTFGDDPKIAQLIKHWIVPLNWQASHERLGLEQASQLLITHLVQHYSSRLFREPKVTGGLSHSQWKLCQEYIEANLSQALELNELAQLVDLSEYHFARLFKQHCGESPHRYVTRQRIELACQLLLNHRLSLAQIAYDLGFSSQAHFSSRFKQWVGISPSQYRQQKG